MGHAVLLTGPERRRRWSLEDRAQILAEAFAPSAVVCEVARRFDVATGLIYTWRRQALAPEAGPAFVPAKLVDVPNNGDAAEPAVCVVRKAEMRAPFSAPPRFQFRPCQPWHLLESRAGYIL
ncbi:transposase [Ensifer sp. MJa1]|uniref:transposase n=1 Tax=Ensifer sp. MJa1 TaxID=2919888 RepID=UPI003FA541A4